MINFAQWNQTQVLLFALVLLRCTSFLVSAAMFSSTVINVHFKILFSLALSMVLFPILSLRGIDPVFVNDNLVTLVIREVLIGVVIGLLSRFFFFTVSMVGDIVSMALGLGAAQMYSPLTGSQSQLIDQFFTWLSMMIFFALGGHHVLVGAIAASFDHVPLAQSTFSTGPLSDVVADYSKLLTIAIQISSPVLVSMVLTNLAMGILGRTVPQINVLVTSFPVSILLGLGVLILTVPLWVQEMRLLLDLTSTELLKFMKAI